MHQWFFLLILINTFPSTTPKGIIVLSAISSMSHFLYLDALLQKLTDRGHNITVIGSRLPQLSGNYTAIEAGLDAVAYQFLSNLSLQTYQNDPLSQIQTLEQEYHEFICRNFVNLDIIKELVHKGKQFDIAIVASIVEECGFIIGNMLGRHVVYVNFFRNLMPIYAYRTGVPLPLSFIPHVAIQNFDSPTLFNRLEKLFRTVHHIHFMRDYRGMLDIVRETFPDAPGFADIHSGMSLVMTNGDPVFSDPAPSMPYAINVGGFHCRPARPLPEDINSIIEASGSNGFILFSLGTLIEVKKIGPTITKAFVEAFARLKQTVIWRSGEMIPGISDNVKLIPWIPQQDLLGHPKIRMFICHGGIFGLQEALYNGVPILGFPTFLDQYTNLGRVEELGCGIRMNLYNASADEIHSGILKILKDKSYKEKMQDYSLIFRNQPESPMNRAIFWMEYLTRNKDLTHLKNPTAQINFFSYFLLDILVFFAILFACFCWFCLKIKTILKYLK